MYNLKIAIVLNTKLSGFLSLVPIKIAESFQFHMENFFAYFYPPPKKNVQNFLSSNEQKVASNEQKVTSNEQKIASNEQKVTSNEQKVTSNEQKLKSNEQKLTNNEQRAKSFTLYPFDSLAS